MSVAERPPPLQHSANSWHATSTDDRQHSRSANLITIIAVPALLALCTRHASTDAPALEACWFLMVCANLAASKGAAPHGRVLTCARTPHRPAGPAAGEAPAQPAAAATAPARRGSMWAAASPRGSTRAPLAALPEAAALAETALPYPIPDSLSGPGTAAQPVAAGGAAAVDADSSTRALAQHARRAAPSVHAPGRSASPAVAAAQVPAPVRVSASVLELSMAATRAR
jgi:hypothetical protein